MVVVVVVCVGEKEGAFVGGWSECDGDLVSVVPNDVVAFLQ